MRSGRAAAISLAALALAAVVPMSGCGPFWVDPYITVKESPLNWIEIHYYNMNRDPVRRVSVYLNGMGHVEVKKGTSDRVSNDFAKHIDDANWDDFKTQRKTVDPKHAQDIFQHLVNFGVLDREKNFKRSKKSEFKRFIAVKANISNNTYSEPDNIFEVDPDLAEELLDVVREFTSGAM
jgi:hypothetical protein